VRQNVAALWVCPESAERPEELLLSRVTSWRFATLAISLVAAVVGFSLVLSSAKSADAQAAPSASIKQLTLTGAEEVPPVTVNAIGYFSGTLTDGNLEFDLSAVGPSITAAHIHLGAKGTNGPAVAFLFGPADPGVGAIHPTGNIKVSNLVGPLAGNWKGFTDALAKGELYVNFHTTANPAGAGRAQIPATPPLPPRTGDSVVANDDFGLTQGLGVAILAGALVTGAFAVSRRRA
jgi:hypothetical protein